METHSVHDKADNVGVNGLSKMPSPGQELKADNGTDETSPSRRSTRSPRPQNRPPKTNQRGDHRSQIRHEVGRAVSAKSGKQSRAR